jgi:UDP-N-acetylglucosamine:LPS N-acetylglucosamine transferase
VPAIFVPNEHPQQDDQLARARFAESQGLGLAVRTSEVYRLPQAIEQLLEPDMRVRIAERCATLAHGSGAVEAAGLVLDMVRTRKVDRP